jgi:hypothetical protein
MLESAIGSLGSTATIAVFADAGFPKNYFERAKVRKGRLQEVEADECGEPEPVMTVDVREREAEQDEHSSEPADDQVHFHSFNLCSH